MPKRKDILRYFKDDELILCSFRYYVGRRTAATCDFARRLAVAWPELPHHIKVLIRRELEDAFRRASCTSGGLYPLGDSCDVEAWEKVRAAYKMDYLGES